MHLILFFDINGTIMLEDSKQGKDLEIAVCQMLAENYSAIWDKNQKESMTYRKYVEKHLAPGNDNDCEIEAVRHRYYRHFIHFLHDSEHPLHAEIAAKHKKIKDNFPAGKKIFASFIALIEYLEKNNIKFSVIFRSFGNDVDNIIAELKERTSLKSFSRSELSREYLNNLNAAEAAKMLSTINPGEHGAWQDNWPYWNQKSETFEGGKPFLIDFNHPNQIAMFFDDHAKNKQIICVKPTQEGNFNQRLLQEKLIDAGRIVPVKKLNASEENNYFIEKVNLALNMPLDIKAENYLVNKDNQQLRFFAQEQNTVASENRQSAQAKI